MKKGLAGSPPVPKEVAGLPFRCPGRGHLSASTPAEGVKYIPCCRGYRCHLPVRTCEVAAGSLSSDPLEFPGS